MRATQLFKISVICGLIILFLSSPLTTSSFSTVNAGSRTGAWVDTVTVSIAESGEILSGLQTGSVDFASDATIDQMNMIDVDVNLTANKSLGLNYVLMTNPSGPFFQDGRLNPFHDHKIREALNWLVNRNYITQTLLGGRAGPRYFAITPSFPDYVRYQAKVNELEAKYAYDFAKANSIINQEMENLGAIKNANGKWIYEDNLVTVIFIIRNDGDGNRLPIGDYIADQLEAVGFTVDRQYLISPQANPIWFGSIPSECECHI